MPKSDRRPAGASTDPENLASLLQDELGNVEIVQVVRGTCLVSSDTDAVPASVVGRSDTESVMADRLISRRLGVGPGDRLEVISARQRLTPMGPLPVRIRTEVERVTSPEPGSESGEVILPIAQAQRLLWGEPVVEALELRDADDPWSLGQRAREILDDRGLSLRVAGLEELHRPLLTALALEKIMIFVAVGLMLVVAALNLLCNVAMVAAEKRKDLAVMAGLGFTPRSLRRLFLVLGTRHRPCRFGDRRRAGKRAFDRPRPDRRPRTPAGCVHGHGRAVQRRCDDRRTGRDRRSRVGGARHVAAGENGRPARTIGGPAL